MLLVLLLTEQQSRGIGTRAAFMRGMKHGRRRYLAWHWRRRVHRGQTKRREMEPRRGRGLSWNMRTTRRRWSTGKHQGVRRR